jgi:hypothetical protein
VHPQAATSPPIGFYGHASVAEELEIAAHGAKAYAKLSRELGRRNVLSCPEKPLELVEALTPSGGATAGHEQICHKMTYLEIACVVLNHQE